MPIASINPATGETIETFQTHSTADVDQMLNRAVAAHQMLRRIPVDIRAQLLLGAADRFEAAIEDLALVMTLEMGKTLASARAEAAKCVKAMRFYAEHGPSMVAEERPVDPSVVGAQDTWVSYQPLGVVLAVMPWNYPAWQVVRFAAPALIAGNACLLRHASNVPRTALKIAEILSGGDYPEGAFQTLLVDTATVADLIADRRVAAVTLTGSEGAGIAVAAAAGKALKKAVLELGGTDPFVVLPTADVAEAARVGTASRSQNAGQSCVCAKRFIVHSDVYEQFVDQLTDRMAALRIGDPLDPEVDLGPLATTQGRSDVHELVQDAVAKGAVIRTGGVLPDGPGSYYPPTVVEGVDRGMRLWSEEAFGPVAAVIRVDSVDDAFKVANDSDLGLSSSVWTKDPQVQDRAVAEIDAGAVFVNGMTASFPELPFGGIKRSGYGRELAANGLREFCNIKTVWKK